MSGMSDTDAEKKNIDEIALDHAWKWFEYHASQRMTMIRFYVIAAGGIAAGTGILLTTFHENLLAGFLSILGVLTSLAFKRLDRRVSDLIKIGEEALKPIQAEIGTAIGSQTFEICRIAGVKPNGVRFYSYGENFTLLFTTLTVGFLIVGVVSFGRLIANHAVQICQIFG